MNNHYSDMYLFSRPKPEFYGNGEDQVSWQNAMRDYNLCKSYILDYRGYSMS